MKTIQSRLALWCALTGWFCSWANLHHLGFTVFSCVPPGPLSHSSLSSLDDDYSDTYNATYAVINSGETCFAHSGFLRLPPPVLRLGRASPPLSCFLTDDYSLSSNPTMAHPAPRTHTYRPLAKSPSNNGGGLREPSPSPVPPPPPPMPSILQLRARDSERDKDPADAYALLYLS